MHIVVLTFRYHPDSIKEKTLSVASKWSFLLLFSQKLIRHFISCSIKKSIVLLIWIDSTILNLLRKYLSKLKLDFFFKIMSFYRRRLKNFNLKESLLNFISNIIFYLSEMSTLIYQFTSFANAFSKYCEI